MNNVASSVRRALVDLVVVLPTLVVLTLLFMLWALLTWWPLQLWDGTRIGRAIYAIEDRGATVFDWVWQRITRYASGTFNGS